MINRGNNNDPMKRSPSELDFQAAINDQSHHVPHNNDHHNIRSSTAVVKSTPPPQVDPFFENYHSNGFVDPTAGVVVATDLPFDFKNNHHHELINELSICGGFDQNPSWYYQNIPPKEPCVSAIDSQSSICAGSPTSILKTKAGDNQGSGSSEDDDGETEAGQCDLSDGTLANKRQRRMVSNRESARRSRRRKQAHLQDLELQVEQLGGENVTLYKQLTDATTQLKDATTNNRVLKSDVEALRAKVKLAEDMVTRGSLSCSLNHLIQTQLNSPQMLSTQNLSRIANVAPTVMVRGQDGSFGTGFSGQNSGIVNDGLAHVLNGNGRSGLVSENISCVSDMWP